MENQKTPLLNPVLRLFLFTMVLANIAGEMSLFLLPLYLTYLGASITQVGLVFTLSSLVPVALQIFGGWLSDSIGRLRTIAIGSVGGVLGYVFMVLAPSWEWVLVGVSVGFFARALVGPSFGSFIAEQSTEANRGRVYGISEGIFMIVSVIGPPLGGLLVENFSFRVMMIFAMVLYTFAAVLRFGMAGRAKKTTEANPQKLTLSSLRSSLGVMFGLIFGGGILTWVFLTDGVRDVAFRMSGELLPIYLEDIGGLSVLQIGWLGSIFGIAMMLTTWLSGWLADHYGERVPIVAGFFLQGVALVVLLSAGGFLGFAAIWFLFGLGVGIMNPAYQSLVSKAVPESNRGLAFGMFRTSLGIISLPAPYIGATLWERFSPRVPFVVTAVASFLTIVPAWLKFRLPPKPAAPEELAPQPIGD